jgi:hypothetical protein
MPNEFAIRHLLHKQPLQPNLDQRSTTNTTLYQKSIKSEQWQSLQQAAGEKHCCVTADYNGTNIKNASTLILGHFCPPGMNADQPGYGILSTFQTGVDPDNNDGETLICYNSLPTNESVWTVYHSFAQVISNRYGLGLQDARVLSVELCAWADVVPVILPHNAADPGNDSDYWELREKMDMPSMKYIQYIMKEVLTSVEVLIAVGDHSFDFAENMIRLGMIDLAKVTFVNHSPVIHPTKLLKFGPTLRQRHWLYQTITDMLTHTLGQPRVNVPSQEVMVLSEHRTNNNHDTHGNYVYYGFFRGKRILIGRSCAHFLQLLREAYVSTGPFESQGTLLETEDRSGDIDGLEVKLVWYTKHNDELHRGLQFGYQFPLQDNIMKEWMKVAGEKQRERLVDNAEKKRPPQRNDAGRAIRDNSADFFDQLENMEKQAKSHKSS